MIIFLKAQLSSCIATIVDFSFTICLIEGIAFHYIMATALGAIAGAVTNFTINKYWSFGKKKNVRKQAVRYLFVWLGSITLNVTGSSLFLNVFAMPYTFSKMVVAFLVGFTFNYMLQKYYVFKTA